VRFTASQTGNNSSQYSKICLDFAKRIRIRAVFFMVLLLYARIISFLALYNPHFSSIFAV
jgi:hypothetical protein